MRKNMIVVLLSIILVTMIAVGCNSSDENDQNNDPEVNNTNNNEPDENNNQEEDDEKTTNNNNENNNNNNNNDNENNEGDNGSSDSGNSDNAAQISLPDPIEINERQQHPNGTILTLEKISFEEDYISVDFTAQNGYDSRIKLAEIMDKSVHPGVVLEDDTGFDYRYLPGDNEYLSVESGERMSGSISFVGRLDEEATSLTLSFNPDYKEDDHYEFNPKFTFEIDIDQ